MINMELFLLLAVAILVLLYRNYRGQNISKFFSDNFKTIYDKFAPYSYKVVREKTKELGQEYTIRDYAVQIVFFGLFAVKKLILG